jgi:hypothetical protein
MDLIGLEIIMDYILVLRHMDLVLIGMVGFIKLCLGLDLGFKYLNRNSILCLMAKIYVDRI